MLSSQAGQHWYRAWLDQRKLVANDSPLDCPALSYRADFVSNN